MFFISRQNWPVKRYMYISSTIGSLLSVKIKCISGRLHAKIEHVLYQQTELACKALYVYFIYYWVTIVRQDKVYIREVTRLNRT